ncbi:MAG: hypothetical protein NVSMB62_07510 [Acidobacteriaceae bacterium]
MQPITFPDDALFLEAKAPLRAPDEAHHKTPGKGSIKYGEQQEIIFRDGGKLFHDNDHFFAEPLPQGYFGQSTILFSAAAVAGPKTIHLEFQDQRGGGNRTFQLDLV